MITRGSSVRHDARPHPERQGDERAARVSRRKAIAQPGPLKSFSSSASTASRRSARRRGSSQSTKFAEHDRRRALQHAGQAQLRQHAIEPDTDARRHLRETARSPSAARTRTVCRATPRAARACRPSSGPAASPLLNVSSARRASSPSGSGARQRADERVAIVRVDAAAQACDRASAHETRRCRSCRVRYVSTVVRSLYPMKAFGVCRRSSCSRNGSRCTLP